MQECEGECKRAGVIHRYIHVQEPNVRVIWSGWWKLDDVVECVRWYSYLNEQKGWISTEDTVFIFDEAQGSYKDVELRNDLFKCIHGYPDRRAIAFASYGSPSLFIDIQGTRIFVAFRARVSLLPCRIRRAGLKALSRLRISLPSILPQHGL